MFKPFSALALTAALAAAAPAASQTRGRAADPPPPSTPEEWWADVRVRQDERLDPLAYRRFSRNDERVRANFRYGVDASLYRLWGLQPLQGLSIRWDEAVFEAWYRPTGSARQAVVRVILRGDGKTFVQARAGLGCCAPDILRRVDINEELGADVRRALVRLQQDPVWKQPRDVIVKEGGDVVSSLCVQGAAYDLTLVDYRRAAHLRRSCDPVEIGSVAAAAKTIIGTALGRDARFDHIFARERFDEYRKAYEELVAGGGELAPANAAAGVETVVPAEQAEVQTDPAEEILAADRAFAARSAEVGAARAFQEFMDPRDSLLVRAGGEPLRGAEAIYRHFGGGAPEAGKLLWEPQEAWVAESGDFGASWGVSQWIPNDPTQPRARHRYVTVWRREPGGQWKGLLDIGAPADPPPPAAAPTPAGPPAPAPARPSGGK